MSDIERDWLLYIQASIALIGQYVADGEEAFFNNSMVQDAVLRRLETLADATNKLSDDLKQRHPHIRWRQIYGFRNIAAHAYRSIDLDRVWEVIVDSLPDLKRVIDAELGQANPSAS